MQNNVSGKSNSSHVILIVEDQADTRESLRKLLEIHGYQVETAADGRRGADLLLELRPHVAVIDIGLPNLSGYEIARLAREAGLSTPLVALSGYGMPADKERAMQAGFDVHLTKPADPRDLLAVIAESLVQNRTDD